MRQGRKLQFDTRNGIKLHYSQRALQQPSRFKFGFRQAEVMAEFVDVGDAHFFVEGREVFPAVIPELGKEDRDGRLVTMCHYPMLSYPQARRGYMIYGHIHNNTGDDYWPLIMRRPRMLNAGVDVNNFEPVAFDELLANNNAFQRRHADTAMANPFDLDCAEA